MLERREALPGGGKRRRKDVTMELRFWNDPKRAYCTFMGTGSPKRKCGRCWPAQGVDFPDRENSRVHLGQTSAGRYLKVVSVPDEGSDSAFVVTAYELRGKAL